MKEKCCNYKKINISARPSTRARAADQLLADYTEVFGEPVEDGILEICENIKAGRTIEDYEDSFSKTYDEYDAYFAGPYKATYNRECQVQFGAEGFHYYLYYYFFSSEVYEKTWFNQRHKENSWTIFKASIYRQKGEYRYFCTQRPPAVGCIPDDYITITTFANSRYRDSWCPGEVTMGRLLTSEECYQYGLRLDEKWEQERSGYLSSAQEESMRWDKEYKLDGAITYLGTVQSSTGNQEHFYSAIFRQSDMCVSLTEYGRDDFNDHIPVTLYDWSIVEAGSLENAKAKLRCGFQWENHYPKRYEGAKGSFVTYKGRRIYLPQNPQIVRTE